MRVSKAFLVLCLLLVTLQARASDLVVMRDGSERSGTLELCADDQCRLSGKSIPMEEIGAIFLDGQRKIIPGRSNAIVMRDGSVRDGRVTFVSHSTVDTDNEEIDRSRVAVIIFAGAADEPVSDLLILRDGSVKKGTLTTCSAASCTLDGAMTPLADIEWVGLAREDLIPPSSTGDEVHKVDGTIAAGRLSAIDATTVSTTRGRVPRGETAWIHVAARAPAQPDQPGSFGAPQSPAPPTRPPVQPPRPPRPAPTPPSGGGTPSAGGSTTAPQPDGRRGALWTGIIQARYQGTVDGFTSQLDVDARVRLRERISPLKYPADGAMKTIGTFTWLVQEGTVLRHRFRSSGNGISCRADGSITVSNAFGCSAIWVKDADLDTTPGFKFNVPRGASYQVCVDMNSTASYEVSCGGVDTYPANFISPVIGRHPALTASLLSDPQVRRLDNGPGKMQGTYSIPAVGAYTTLDVSWSICREGVQCSDPPPLPGAGAGGGPGPGRRADDTKDEDDCLTLGRLIDGIRALREAYEAFEASFVEAERNRDQARDSIYGFEGSLAQFFVSLGSLASEALSGPVGDVIGVIGSVLGLAQDPSGDNVAQAVIDLADTEAAFSPAATQGVLNAIQKADAVLEATDSDSSALRTYADELGKSEAAQAKGQNIVKGISVVVSVADYAQKTNDLADSIQSYLDYRSEAARDRASMDEIQNQIEQKLVEIDEARAALDEPCPDIPSTGNVPQRNNANEVSSPYQLVQSTAGAAEPPVTPEEVRTALAALSRVEARVASATPWLLPFFARVTDGVSPRMLRALLRQAEPDLRAVKTDIEAARQAGRDLEQRLGQTSAGTAAE